MISLVVPVYNVEKYLRRFLDSVINQTYQEFELILVDDGSTDNSYSICKEYAEKYKNIILINKTNGGQGSARNLGIKKASGEWIMFADSDDYLHTRMLEIMVNTPDADVIMCDFADVIDSEPCRGSEAIERKMQRITGEEACIELCSKKEIDYLVCWGKLIKRIVLAGVEFPEDKYREDEFFAHRLFSRVKSVVKIDAKLYYYVHRVNSTMTNTNIKMNIDCLKALEERVGYLKDIDECVISTKKRYKDEAILGFKNLYQHYSNNSQEDIKEFIDLFCRGYKEFFPNTNVYEKIYCFLIQLNIYKINNWIAKNDFEPIQNIIRKLKRSR